MINQLPGSDTPFSPIESARQVLRKAATGALATLEKTGAPFASLVNVATTPAGEPILLLSQLAVHTNNLDGDPRASLLLVAPGGETGDPLEGARLTVTGELLKDSDPAHRRRYLARHAEASAYADFADFSFYRFHIRNSHLVAGFGRIVDPAAADLLVDCSNAAALLDAEARAITHMNTDHPDALALYATRLCDMPDAAWIATGMDPEGLDLRAGPLRTRINFPDEVHTPAELRSALAAMSDTARCKQEN